LTGIARNVPYIVVDGGMVKDVDVLYRASEQVLHCLRFLCLLIDNCINKKVEFYNEKKKHWITINRTKQSKKDTYITTLNEFFKLIKKKNYKRNMTTNLASVNESLNVLKVIDLAKKSSNKSKKLFINK
jgi:hypothetical protein